MQNNPVTTGIQSIQNGVNVNVNLNYAPQKANEGNEVDASIVKNDIHNALQYLADLAPEKTTILNSIIDTQHIIAQDTKVQPMIEQIQSIGKQAGQVIDNKKTEIQKLQSTIKNDYPKFLHDIQKNTIKLVADDTDEKSRTTPLLSLDANTQKTLEAQEHPAITILDQDKQIASRYQKALADNHPSTLNMDAGTYSKTKSYMNEVQKTADSALDALHNAQDNPQTITYTPSLEENINSRAEARQEIALATPPVQIAQGNGNNNNTCTNCNSAAQQSSDLSQYINGVYIE